MAFDPRYGAISTANLQVGTKIDMDEDIDILTPTDVPFQQWLGVESTVQTRIDWLEEDLTPQTVTFGTVTGVDAPWTVVVGTGEASYVRPGDVLHLVDGASSVQWLVSTIDTETDTLTLTGFAGNTTDPVLADVAEIVGQYRDEGTTPEEMRSNERDAFYNLTQWGQEKVEATRTARKRDVYGMGDPYDHELMKKWKELAIRFERSLIHGQRVESVDKKKRFMGGLFYYISDNTVSNTKANLRTALNELIRAAYDDGSSAVDLWVSPSIRVAMDGIDANAVQIERADSVRGEVVETYRTSLGTVRLHTNRHLPKTKGLLLDSQYVKRVNFDGYFHETLAKVGDSDQGHIVGEFSLKVKNDKAHGILTVTDA